MSSTTIPVAHPIAGENWLRRWLTPTMPELLFLAITLWLIAYTVTGDATGMGLLHDSQTGYHVRIGEYVLAHHAVPMTDFLSFTLPDQPFFAWEWLAGVGSALLYHWGGLGAIVVVSALVLAFTILLMMRHMAARGANIILAVFLIHLAIGASSIHYLARPHIFTLLFLVISLWVLDRDRENPTPMVWGLVPLTSLWANLHGGFFGLLVSIGILAAGSMAEGLLAVDRRAAAFRRALRWGLLTVACFAASLVNPYGINEHIHLVRFMRQTWYLKFTEEYQAPNFLTAAGGYFGVLLVLGVCVAIRLLWRREFGPGLLILAWSYASARSMRHIPIYAIVALPWIAAEAAGLWRRWAAGKSVRTFAGTLEKLAKDYQPSMMRTSLFAPLVSIALLASPLAVNLAGDFPDPLYPVSLIQRHAGEIGHARVFATDAWGHYLTYRFPPPYKIFIDGRTDFFGEHFSHEYLDTMNGLAGWDETLCRYHVDMVLIPPEIGLAGRLTADPGWRLVERTDMAVLFQRD